MQHRILVMYYTMKAKEDIRKHNLEEIRETIEASKSLKKVRRTHSLGKNRMITLLDKQGK